MRGSAGGMHAEAVAAVGEHVEFGGAVGVEESAIVDEGIFAVAGVVLGGDDEGARGGGVGSVGGIERGLVGIDGEVGGVDEDGEAGARVDGGVDVGGGGGWSRRNGRRGRG